MISAYAAQASLLRTLGLPPVPAWIDGTEALPLAEPWVPALRVAVGVLVFVGFLLLSAVVQALLQRLAAISDPRRRDVLLLAGRSARVLLVIVGTIVALGTAGVDVPALIAGLGLTGFALGFALRDALSNFLAGVLILIYRPFRRGERIKVGDFEGVVVEIDLRYTTLQADGKRFLIPNSKLFTDPITLLEAKP